MKILGLQGGVTMNQHDAAAVILQDGRLVVACEEERFTRFKSTFGYLPIYSIRYCLKEAGLKMTDVDLVVHAGETYPDMPGRIKLYLRHYFGHAPRIEMVNHQLAHAASAFFCSGFEEAMCISYDAYGDRLSTLLARADRQKGIQVLETRPAEQSLGHFYSLMTSFMGFAPDEDEYKVMGLAPYGEKGVDLREIASPSDDGYTINPGFWDRDPPFKSRFEPWYGKRLVSLLGPARLPGDPLSQRHKDIAYATQGTLETCAISLVNRLRKLTGLKNLCLAGGVALNCSANGRLALLPWLEGLFVQPAASDRGLALGCALQAAFKNGDSPSKLEHAFYGPSLNTEEIRQGLQVSGIHFKEMDDPATHAARLLAQGKIVGWFQGRSEFGPRALGHRSILADPREMRMKDLVNAKIKFREEFRPFAPAVLKEKSMEIFEMKWPSSPFMTMAYPVRENWRSRLQATTHVNHTGRVQTVSRETDPLFHRLISEFEKLAGVPVVLNTSFNVRGQPIVETPLDALGTFAASGLDVVILDRFLVSKT